VPITGADLQPQGGSVTIVGGNTALGVASEPNNSPLANVFFSAPQEVDQVVLGYLDQTSFGATQVIGIHDLFWC